MNFCTACGTAKEAGSRYCTGCGAALAATGYDEPDPGPAAAQPRAGSAGRPVLVLTAVALIAGAGTVATWAALSHDTGNSTLPPPALSEPPPSAATTSTSPPTTPSPALSAEDDAQNQLTRQVSLDRPQVQAELAEAWVPQLSSKQWGLVVDGTTYHYTEILNDHLALRSAYDARLLWSGDWSSFGKDDFFVTVAPVPFPTPEATNAWCDTQSIEPENCLAKRLSTVTGPEGSTVSR